MFKRKDLQKEAFPNLHVNSPQILDVIWIMYMWGGSGAAKTLNREQKLESWKPWVEISTVTYLRSNRVRSLSPIKLQSIGKHLRFLLVCNGKALNDDISELRLHPKTQRKTKSDLH